MPEELRSKILDYYGEDNLKDIEEAFNATKKTTLRINKIKSSYDEICEALKDNDISYSNVSWSDFSLVLDEDMEEKVKSLSIYSDGKIYLQSLSSQLPPVFLNPKSGELILDMTAAPGGKTTEIAMISNNEAMITAIEVNKKRFERLKYNVLNQGSKKVTVLNTNATSLDKYFMFDKILLDAPCSGSGTISKDNTKFDYSIVSNIVNVQKKLIEEAISHLNVNGELVYSTCSILKEENEDIVRYVLDKYDNLELVKLDTSKYLDVPFLDVNIDGTMCVKPTDLYEGFFVAKIKKVK